jgi:hypothetical protein
MRPKHDERIQAIHGAPTKEVAGRPLDGRELSRPGGLRPTQAGHEQPGWPGGPHLRPFQVAAGRLTSAPLKVPCRAFSSRLTGAR